MAKNQFLPAKVRRPREEMRQVVGQIEGPMGLKVAGSWRRHKETVGDLDILVPSERDFGETIEEFIAFFGYEPIRSGAMKSEGIAVYRGDPLLINLWRVPEPRAWAAMLLFATGPNDLNIMMRSAAKSRGWKLSQYGLFDDEEHQRDKGEAEEQIFALLGMPYLTPLEREDWQEHNLGAYASETTVVEVLSSDGVTIYHVELKDGVGFHCECKGFSYRQKCRHLTEAEAKARG